MAIRCRSTRSHNPTPQASRTQESGRLVPGKLRSWVRNQTYGSRLTFGGRMTDRSVGLPIYSLHSSRKMAFETADGHRAYVLALARIRFRGTCDAVHRNRPRGVARVEHLTRLAPP